jgi:hypothetical protein
LEEIFGDEGLINADDIVCFEIKCSEIEERAKALSSKFHLYFDNKWPKISVVRLLFPFLLMFVYNKMP